MSIPPVFMVVLLHTEGPGKDICPGSVDTLISNGLKTDIFVSFFHSQQVCLLYKFSWESLCMYRRIPCILTREQGPLVNFVAALPVCAFLKAIFQKKVL